MGRNKQIFLIALLVAILPLPFFVYVSKRVVPKTENKQVRSSINQIVNFGGVKPTIRTKVDIKQEETALELLRKASQVVVKGEGEAAYVVGINKVVADDAKKEYWAFYVNGRLAPVGAGSYKLVGGEQIEWKLENY